jgi:hypothetical protein
LDGQQFDDLTRKLAGGLSRRSALKGLVAGAAVAIGWRRSTAAVTQAQCGNTVCIADPTVCPEGCGCCAFGNGNSRCMPPDLCIRLGGEVTCPEGQVFDPEAGGCVDVCAVAGSQCDTGMVCSGGSCQGNGVCTTGDFSNNGCGGPGCGAPQNACLTDTEGAFICAGSVNCGSITFCPNGSSDCPSGFACLPGGGGCGGNTCQPICTGPAGATVHAATTVDGDFNSGR